MKMFRLSDTQGGLLIIAKGEFRLFYTLTERNNFQRNVINILYSNCTNNNDVL